MKVAACGFDATKCCSIQKWETLLTHFYYSTYINCFSVKEFFDGDWACKKMISIKSVIGINKIAKGERWLHEEYIQKTHSLDCTYAGVFCDNFFASSNFRFSISPQRLRRFHNKTSHSKDKMIEIKKIFAILTFRLKKIRVAHNLISIRFKVRQTQIRWSCGLEYFHFFAVIWKKNRPLCIFLMGADIDLIYCKLLCKFWTKSETTTAYFLFVWYGMEWPIRKHNMDKRTHTHTMPTSYR